MPHTTGLLSTFVISLFAAFAGGLLARSIRLPPLVGYLCAGIVVGPFTPGYVANQAVASELAEVGVALLLFNIGLHFSIKDLMKVRKIALIGALCQITIGTALGTFLAVTYLEIPPLAATIIGLAFAIASTAAATRMLEERHQVTSFAGRIALGWLVVQDLVVIIALVLLPPLAKAESGAIGPVVEALGRTMLQIAGFIVIMLLIGRRVIPMLLGYVARLGSREMFTLAVIVVALGLAYGASMVFGISLALGAFVAGVVISESDLNHHTAAEALSMQQVFTILFFVSVGMLFDPHSLIRYPIQVLLFWGVVVLGMGAVTLALLLALRVPTATAALVGGAFTQVGEFSFVLAELGCSWGVIGRAEHDLILAVALISIVTNPLVMFVFNRLGLVLDRSTRIARWQQQGQTNVGESSTATLADHIILVGYGRVGRLLATAFERHNIPYIIIESDRRLMEKLRHANRPVVFGDAGREAVLSAAMPGRARLIVLALPEGSAARRIAALVRKIYPTLDMIVRVHSDGDARHLARLSVSLTVMGEREIALGLSAYALQRYGVESQTILETMDHLRDASAAAPN